MTTSVKMCTPVIHCHTTLYALIWLISLCSSRENTVGSFFNVGKEFKTLLFLGKFVDKTLLIQEILNRDEKVFQICRPMQWGKTINLEILMTFFGIEHDSDGKLLSEEKKANPIIFKGGKITNYNGRVQCLKPLNISEDTHAMSHLGKHPVIALNLKEVKGRSVTEIEKQIKNLVIGLFGRYPFIKNYTDNGSSLLDDDEKKRLSNFISGNLEGEYLFNCLELLSMVLFEHYHSYVCLLIDDYDLPLINAYLAFGSRSKELRYVEEMFRMLYKYTFKENQYLFKAVMTGTLNIEIVPSGFSEFEYRYILYSSVLDKDLFNFYGLDEYEIHKLDQTTLKINWDKIKKWYGGFFCNGLEVYNLGSVLDYAFVEGKVTYHLLKYVGSDMIKFIYSIIVSEQSHEELHLLSEGKTIIRNEFSKSLRLRTLGDDIASLLVHVGLLSVELPRRVTEQPVWRMKIPNLEVRGIFASAFKTIAAGELKIGVTEYNNFISLLIGENVDDFTYKFNVLLLGLKTFNTTKRDEQLYHNLMNNIAASFGVGYIVDSIKEYGDYRGEHMIIPLEGYGTCAFIIEYTVCTPWQPLEQFVHFSLITMLQRPKVCKEKILSFPRVSRILYVAIGFCGQKLISKFKSMDIR